MFRIFTPSEEPRCSECGADPPQIDGRCAECVHDENIVLSRRPKLEQWHRLREERDDFHRRLCIAQGEYQSLKHQFDQLWDANRSILRDLRAARAALKAAENPQKTA